MDNDMGKVGDLKYIFVTACYRDEALERQFQRSK